jgi:CubicO group peptidase (beta-lactamase class C family)
MAFTALAVMRLAEQGKLALDQPVRRYLPEPTGFGNGSGGVLSTANDLARWLIAQNAGLPGLLSPHASGASLVPQARAMPDARGAAVVYRDQGGLYDDSVTWDSRFVV